MEPRRRGQIDSEGGREGERERRVVEVLAGSRVGEGERGAGEIGGAKGDGGGGIQSVGPFSAMAARPSLCLLTIYLALAFSAAAVVCYNIYVRTRQPHGARGGGGYSSSTTHPGVAIHWPHCASSPTPPRDPPARTGHWTFFFSVACFAALTFILFIFTPRA